MTKKEIIQETMLKLIAEQGVQATPMSQIARESGVSTGTIYHHFSSKEEILQEIYLNKKKDFRDMIEMELQDKDPLEKQFARLWVAIYYYYINNPLLFRFSQQIAGTPLINPETKKTGLTYHTGIFEFFQSGISAGRFVEMEVSLMAELIHGIICTLVELQLNGELDKSDKHIKDAVDFSWQAIAK